MIRNKTHWLVKAKQVGRGGNKFIRQDWKMDYPFWVEDVYRQKEVMKQISLNSISIIIKMEILKG